MATLSVLEVEGLEKKNKFSCFSSQDTDREGKSVPAPTIQQKLQKSHLLYTYKFVSNITVFQYSSAYKN